MKHVERSVLVPYSAKEMYQLVNAVEAYPEFLPWCSGATVQSRTTQGLIATLLIDFHGLRQSFTTRNKNRDAERIEVELVDGPFKSLVGIWDFSPLSVQACRVSLNLHYSFSNFALEFMVNPVFSRICDTFVDEFVKRAEAVYGAR